MENALPYPSLATATERSQSIVSLARRLTASSVTLDDEGENNPINPVKGSQLDPFSPRFDSVKWMQALVQMFESGLESAPQKRAGVAFRNLTVFGHGSEVQYQKSTGNVPYSILLSLLGKITGRSFKRINILQEFEGVVHPGELLLVLGPPGSGCSTLLKTLSGRTEGFNIDRDSYINYRGINPQQMHNWFRADVLYNAEVDVHLAPLSVGDTLEFAALSRVPAKVPGGFSKRQFARAYRDAIMATFGISHTSNTKVGDDFIRGVSGGERKRVSIAEAALTGAKLQCWDNSTRGLDSGNAITFCKSLRAQADVMGVAAMVAIYQAPQSAYETFDKVTVLYEGHQIYFGRIEDAKAYFENLGFECPDSQTTADFLTSMTSPQERRVRPGFEGRAPRTPVEFAVHWKTSNEHTALAAELDKYEDENPSDERLSEFVQSRKTERNSLQRLMSPYATPYVDQVRLCIWRGWKRLLADPAFTVSSLLFNLIMGFVLGSAFYNLPNDTSSFYHRGGVVFFALLFNAFAGELEVLTLYAQRPVVEKHHRYAFYHQSAEAVSSYIMDLPYKFINCIMFNTTIYFLVHLRREPGRFFFFVLTSFLLTLTMSGLYRTVASITRTSHQALVPVSLITIGVMIYAGFTIPTDYMPGWSRWMGYINPLSYCFEALMVNEFSGRSFPCSEIVPTGPGYDNLPFTDRVCAALGAISGEMAVDGDRYLQASYGYSNAHKWRFYVRNIGILCGFMVLFIGTYLLAAEYAKPPKTSGEVLVFRRGKIPSVLGSASKQDAEMQSLERPIIEKPSSSIDTEPQSHLSPSLCQKPVFHWENICYRVKIKGSECQILDHVDGWVQPGVTTALMGASGAGKTTLLDALAARLSVGVLTGDMLVNGKPTNASFSHSVGYVQQQDLHLNTTTVREALQFSALLRQSAEIPHAEKLAYVDEVIQILEMEPFADAIVGFPGEGLNVEQRKRLTIGVELVARPELLVFLDEPTSGLDSQTSWSICDLITKLAKKGQAILCTIHQPSAMLFSRFDRLLLLQPGGKTVYFGDIGPGSRTMIEYFERNGAPRCPPQANPAEWMLKTTLPSTQTVNWSEIWRSSPEYQEVKAELGRLRQSKNSVSQEKEFASQHRVFVTSFWSQLREVLLRTLKHFWRSPVYTWSKLSVTALFALYLGFSFRGSGRSLQGLQNQLYAFFMAFLIQNPYNKQIMPFFTPQRALYEVRERPAKIYSWSVFMLSQIITEVIWNTFCAALFFFCWYYPVGFYENTGNDTSSRGFTAFLFVWQLILWVSTLSQGVIAPFETADLAAVPASLIAILSMTFCGIGITREQLPAIWSDFMYYVSPLTYLASGALSTALHGINVTCSPDEIVRVPVQQGISCVEYMGPFVQNTGGILVDMGSVDVCGWCSLRTSDEFLKRFGISFGDRWRNFGILWAYVVFNIAAALGLYWLGRVPKKQELKRGQGA
ncbi:ZEB2-regulated ABC transporter 1 [Colletotrichum spaethianum]|uniref:ZEB2-regulated ABC transporter 1 n=1 Tax=Colletotrichum spaethianum TaxID=700344 RepID=A0AA37P4Z7_9PEZI|nr:ZEB2-regulated ABC transporter 1 [Colletotrichum spaethianum]GKT42486.1 ZEB2-regulated ABC transporter 1 [Colletotrichum spaethianum]